MLQLLLQGSSLHFILLKTIIASKGIPIIWADLPWIKFDSNIFQSNALCASVSTNCKHHLWGEKLISLKYVNSVNRISL